MDSLLVQLYRVVDGDLKMLYDILENFYHYVPRNKMSTKAFASGLMALVKKESESRRISGNGAFGFGESSASGATLETSSDPAMSTSYSPASVTLRSVLWEFCHGVLLKFTVEELSQYPFWKAKIQTTLLRMNYPSEFFELLAVDGAIASPILSSSLAQSTARRLKWMIVSCYRNVMANLVYPTNILVALHGSVPYLAAACISNFSQLKRSFRDFFVTILATIPRSPSMMSMSGSASHQHSGSSSEVVPGSNRYSTDKLVTTINGPLLLRRQMSANNMSGVTIGNSDSTGNSLNVSTQLTNSAGGAASKKSSIFGAPIVMRVFTSLVIHPITTLTLQMIVTPKFASSNWMASYFSIMKDHGIRHFFLGWRASVILSACNLITSSACSGLAHTTRSTSSGSTTKGSDDGTVSTTLASPTAASSLNARADGDGTYLQHYDSIHSSPPASPASGDKHARGGDNSNSSSSGRSISGGISTIAITGIFLNGIFDSILYRCMLGLADKSDVVTGGLFSVTRNMLTTDCSLLPVSPASGPNVQNNSVFGSPRNDGGIMCLFEYSILTLFQIVPGYITFVTCKAMLWMIFGSTAQRRRQREQRRMILEAHWSNMFAQQPQGPNAHVRGSSHGQR